MSTASVHECDAVQNMSEDATAKMQELIYSLKNSIEHHREAADKVDDPTVRSVFGKLANERENLLETIGGFMEIAGETPDESSSMLGKLKTCWTSFRTSLNGGDPTVVLIEAERAEDALVDQFKNVLPQIAGNPVNDKMLSYFEQIKAGHDEVLAMRNAYQARA